MADMVVQGPWTGKNGLDGFFQRLVAILPIKMDCAAMVDSVPRIRKIRLKTPGKLNLPRRSSHYGEMAERLRHLRLTFSQDDNAHTWARRINISYKRWNNFECGYPLSLDAAHLLVRVIPGL